MGVFLTIWHCNLSAELTKTHRLFFGDFAHWAYTSCLSGESPVHKSKISCLSGEPPVHKSKIKLVN